jgi:hypothetical protein
MVPAKFRFWGALIVFLAWLAYLAFLVSEKVQNRVVLSRPQFLVSTLDVIAEVDDLASNQVVVKEVHWPAGHDELVGKMITVTNLAECKEDWNGPGEYILPLLPQKDEYRVAPLPRSPGFPAYAARPRMYPATPDTRQQLQDIRKATDLK